MRLLIVGAGSTGGYLGGRLAQAGRDVAFLVRPAREAELRETGLNILSPHGNISVRPKLIMAGAELPRFEAILLTVKGFQLEGALDDLASAVGPETIILPVLNGMRHMDIISARFDPHNLVGCALRVATVLEDDGRIVQLTPLQDLAYGELDGSTTVRIQALDRFMTGAGIGARLSGSILREMWEKWILLASLGAITCLMRGTIGDIEACSGGAAFATQLLDEVVAIIKAVGEPPSDEFLSSARQQVTAKGSPLASSMFRDLNRGRPIEVEAIIGDLIRRGAKAKLTTPLLSAAYTHLLVYEKRADAH